jgi:hypothetical protein
VDEVKSHVQPIVEIGVEWLRFSSSTVQHLYVGGIHPMYFDLDYWSRPDKSFSIFSLAMGDGNLVYL